MGVNVEILSDLLIHNSLNKPFMWFTKKMLLKALSAGTIAYVKLFFLQVSKCKRCNVRYDAIPRHREWGWAEFACNNINCGHVFRYLVFLYVLHVVVLDYQYNQSFWYLYTNMYAFNIWISWHSFIIEQQVDTKNKSESNSTKI